MASMDPTVSLAQILEEVERPGDFYFQGSVQSHLPWLEVEGLGPISFPLPAEQARRLAELASRAPYGRGDKTIVDPAVRSTWQIGADKLTIEEEVWLPTLGEMMQQAAEGLGLTSGRMGAQLYKLLLYEKGDFFLEHRDTEKAEGMFATLIVVLPSAYEGGELVIRHEEREAVVRLSGRSLSRLEFVAFYADCRHELRPITAGRRLCLVYNLIRDKVDGAVRPPDYRKQAGEVARLLRRWPERPEWPAKIAYVLAHQYTQASLGFTDLKGEDAAAAAVLRSAARQADCELLLAMISIEESGLAEHSGYGGSWDEDEDEDEFEVVEVIDRTQSVGDWRTPGGEAFELGPLPLEDEEISPPGSLEDEEPDDQHFMEATGNEGASFERAYRRAALVLWPKSGFLKVFNQAGLDSTLPYLASLAERWSKSGAGQDSADWKEAHGLAGHMLDGWQASSSWSQETPHEAGLLSSLATLGDGELLKRYCSKILPLVPLDEPASEALVRGLPALGWGNGLHLLPPAIEKHMEAAPGFCIELLAKLVAGEAASAPEALPLKLAVASAVVGKLKASAKAVSARNASQKKPGEPIEKLLRALLRLGDLELLGRAVACLVAAKTGQAIDLELIPALLALDERRHAALEPLRSAVLDHLRLRIAEPLEAPSDWRRDARLGCACDDCNALKLFLESRQQRTWSFKAAEVRRRHLEEQITRHRCDLDFSTLQKSRPYSLECVKNQNSYERRVAQRKQDLAFAERLTASG